ncbi:MAG: esterase [Burkholderiaceae bacterium]|jgi:predicted esterase|nr:esterase [Burkholderiaceae bacterium]
MNNTAPSNFNPGKLEEFDFSSFPPSVLGRLSFRITPPVNPPLPPGGHLLGVAEERDTLLIVPEGLEPGEPVPLLVMFHGAGGSAEKVLPFLDAHAKAGRFLLMLPQSIYPTWDLTIGGHGPDIERLEKALAVVSSHFVIDPDHFGFAGFSDGGSYALSAGITNGNLLSHVIVFSGGFMNVYHKEGRPLVFIAHSPEDEQLNIKTSGLKHYEQLRREGYNVHFQMFSGPHIIHPPVVEKAMTFFLRKTPKRT